ncbi:MAG TPA: aldo/keto reductase [Planctomycetota bacterium]|nr:aldo/keto reductase [Planctomycetota bacterium]
MLYRRFGKTNLQMPIFSCGGMRYQQSWNDADAFTPASQKNLEACIHCAIELGINHIETARGYGTSEEQLGHVLPKLPREKIIVQTKVGPTADPADFLKTFDKSMRLLKLDYVDLLGLHGINNEERMRWSIRSGGCLDAALKLKAQGRVRHVGFSTHGGLKTILDTIGDGRFEYVNLHWYYVNQFNWPAIELATKLDMGVFIISPNDKGGKLYAPSKKLVELTAPFSPMVFNDAWCLSHPQVHTLSLGVARPSDFDEHIKALPLLAEGLDTRAAIAPVESRLNAELDTVLGADWMRKWHVGVPDWDRVPGEVNIFEILRLRNFAKAFDMLEYGKMRYNLLGNADHWFPGNRADKLDGLDFSGCLKDSPFREKIPAYLAEAHELMSGQEVKRLGKS